MSEFLELVGSILTPALAEVGLLVTDTRAGDSFGDAYAVFDGQDFRVRVIRDRGQVFVDIASATEATNWFNLPIVAAVLGFEASNEAPGIDDETKLSWIATLVRSQAKNLEAAFTPAHYKRTKQRLEEAEERSKVMRFGIGKDH